MERRPQHISLVLGMGVLALMLRPVMAADVSKADLAKMEREVQAQNLEHKKLQAQATQISLELTRISKDMIASAKQIQSSEEKSPEWKASWKLCAPTSKSRGKLCC